MSKGKLKNQQPDSNNKDGLVIKVTSEGPYSVCLRSITDFLANHEEDTVDSLERSALTDNMLLINLSYLRRSIEIAQQNGRRLANQARGQGVKILQRTQVILRAMYNQVERADRAIQSSPYCVKEDNRHKRSWLVRHVVRAYKGANAHRRELELLSSEIDERAYKNWLAEVGVEGIKGGKEQPWVEDAPDYMLLSEAIVKFAGGKPALPTLSKKVGKIPVRYMRRGRRCKVHIGDFREYAQKHYLSDGLAAEITDEYMADIEARKAEERKHRPKKQ